MTGVEQTSCQAQTRTLAGLTSCQWTTNAQRALTNELSARGSPAWLRPRRRVVGDDAKCPPVEMSAQVEHATRQAGSRGMLALREWGMLGSDG